MLAIALRPRRVTDRSSAYTGSEACRACHAGVVDAWQSSLHHLAMLPAARRGGPVVARDGGLVMTGAALGISEDVPLTYVLGFRHVEQYVGPLAPGRLQALPLAFDPVRGEWFDLFEGEGRRPEDFGHWTNRGMNADAQCIFCHTTGYEKGYQPDADTYRSRWVEMGVGCEACHGPGGVHVRAPRAPGDPYARRNPPALLGACESCHSRRVEHAPYVPGGEFLDSFEPELLDTDLYYADGQVKAELYEVVSFQMSRMYAQGVRCWNCHDVHGGGTKGTGNALCLGCHAPSYGEPGHTHHAAEGTGAACVGCHMPVTTYMRRDPRHDHSFPRPDPCATLALDIPNACTSCHADENARWAAEQVRAWFPDSAERERRRDTARQIQQARHGDPASLPALLALLRGPGDVVRRATAARLLAHFPTSEGVTPALLTALHDPEPLVRAGAAWTLAQRSALTPDARAGLVDALGDGIRLVRLSAAPAIPRIASEPLAPAALRTLETAEEEWRASEEHAADTLEGHYNLALFAAARGDPRAAEFEYRTALRLWPTSSQVRHNLGMLLATQGRLAEAEAEFRAVLDRDAVPETAFALGLLYGQQGRWREAAAALERCVAAAPSYPRARYNLGLAYAKAGEEPRALDVLEQAANDPATHEEAVRTIIDVARATNDRQRLQRWVLEAARLDPSVEEDPSLRDLLGQ